MLTWEQPAVLEFKLNTRFECTGGPFEALKLRIGEPQVGAIYVILSKLKSKQIRWIIFWLLVLLRDSISAFTLQTRLFDKACCINITTS